MRTAFILQEDIEAYRRRPVKLKLQWLEEQMEFLQKAMPAKAKEYGRN